MCNRAEFFLNDVGIKRPKTIYNNLALVSVIWHHVIKHIQNLVFVLANLEKEGRTIAEAKSQLCCSGIKIIVYICDSKRKQSDISMVMKS